MDKNRYGRIILPQIYQDHMMLQREKTLRIRGSVQENVERLELEYRADAEGTVHCREAAVLSDGTFACDLPALPAGCGELLFFVNGEEQPEAILHDVLVGDIWLAGGQSNMEYFLRYDAHWNDIRREPYNGQIRMYNVPRIAFEGHERGGPEEDGRWFTQGDPDWPAFSAPGYCFARDLQERLQVPVGVIGCNWGGTSACAWMEREYLKDEPLNVYLTEYEQEVRKWDPEELRRESMRCWEFEDSYRHQLEWRAMMYGLTWEEQQQWMKEHRRDPALPLGPYHHYQPCGLYHTMIRTVAPFSIKGFLWYQGESDSGHAALYDQMMEKLVQCFRDTWEDGSLPFLYVQIAPFERWLDCRGDDYPELRRSQERAAKRIPHAWMTCISDLGDRDDIHPKFKREVGQRLALLARGKVYGEELLCEPPEFFRAEQSGNEIKLRFLHAEGGLVCGSDAAGPFCVTLDGKEIPVKEVRAEAEGLTVLLDLPADGQTDETACRIAFADTPYHKVAIWNQSGLPVKPFIAETVKNSEG